MVTETNPNQITYDELKNSFSENENVQQIVTKTENQKIETTKTESTQTESPKSEDQKSENKIQTQLRTSNTATQIFEITKHLAHYTESKTVIQPLINQFTDHVLTKIDEMCDQFNISIYDVKGYKEMITWIIDNKNIGILEIARVYENYRNNIELYKKLIKHYDLLVSCFQVYPCGYKDSALSFELFLSYLYPESIYFLIDKLNKYKKLTISIMMRFIDYITHQLRIDFENMFIKCQFIQEFLTSQTSNVIDYCKILELSEKLNTVDKKVEIQDRKYAWNELELYGERISANTSNAFLEYFEKMNELVKQIVSSSKYSKYSKCKYDEYGNYVKYIKRELTLEDFFEKDK